MANHVMLNSNTHQNLRVRQLYGAAFGDNVGTAPTFITEFADVQREYPIFFRRDKEGAYFAVALLGFSPDENLYLEGDRWAASYVPAIVARGPFLIGFQERQDGDKVVHEPVLHLDMDSPRVSETEGERLFLEQGGGHTPFLQRMSRILGGINEGHVVNKAMFDAFVSMDLISPVDLEVKITGAQPANLRGFYAVDREKLNNLDAAKLHELHRSGFLHAAYLTLASHGVLNRLIERKVNRMKAAAA